MTFLDNASSASLGFNYVLYPGNHRAYKNLERLIEGYAKSGIADHGIHLVFTGSENSALRRLAEKCGVGEKFHFLGSVPLGEIQKVYRGAEAIAFVSLFEGFGLPILEGMASSVPVVTSNVTSMPEIAGDAALIVDPYSVDEIAAALKLVTSNELLRQTLVEKGRARVMQFSWDRSANSFWALIRRCAEQQAGIPKLQVKG
jgi:glycosyltransferase involved in cell wall biosynthesis